MLFSILIANYNNSRFLQNAISSVQNQTYSNWEIILVDDASTDNFKEVSKQLVPDKRIKIYHNENNKGCGYTKRKSAELAHGEILAFLDPDDALTPDALQIMHDAHVNHPDYSLIYSTHYICDSELAVIRIAEYPKALPDGVPYLLLSDGSVHHFATFKKSCYQKTVGLSAINKKAVDQDLYYKLEETGKFLFINTPLYFYRIHEGGISTLGKKKEATLAHYPIIQESCIRRIKALQLTNDTTKIYWIRKYKTRYHKVKILKSIGKKEWLNLVSSLSVYFFTGGLGNIISYCKKIPTEGIGLLKKTFMYDQKIKV